MCSHESIYLGSIELPEYSPFCLAVAIICPVMILIVLKVPYASPEVSAQFNGQPMMARDFSMSSIIGDSGLFLY